MKGILINDTSTSNLKMGWSHEAFPSYKINDIQIKV